MHWSKTKGLITDMVNNEKFVRRSFWNGSKVHFGEQDYVTFDENQPMWPRGLQDESKNQNMCFKCDNMS